MPVQLPGVIGVSSEGRQGTLATSNPPGASNYGFGAIDLVAPGGDPAQGGVPGGLILSTFPSYIPVWGQGVQLLQPLDDVRGFLVVVPGHVVRRDQADVEQHLLEGSDVDAVSGARMHADGQDGEVGRPQHAQARDVVFRPGLRLVTASPLWSTLIRSPHGSDVVSKGPM